MSDLLVRGLRIETLRRLKARAKQHGRSLQGEAKALIEQAAGGRKEVANMLNRWQKRLAGRKMASSADLIRRDRER